MVTRPAARPQLDTALTLGAALWLVLIDPVLRLDLVALAWNAVIAAGVYWAASRAVPWLRRRADPAAIDRGQDRAAAVRSIALGSIIWAFLIVAALVNLAGGLSLPDQSLLDQANHVVFTIGLFGVSLSVWRHLHTIEVP